MGCISLLSLIRHRQGNEILLLQKHYDLWIGNRSLVACTVFMSAPICGCVRVGGCGYVSKDDCANSVSMCAIECSSVHCLGQYKIKELFSPALLSTIKCTSFHSIITCKPLF